MRKKAIWPNLVTAGNLFLGYLAIINIIQGKYITASWLIIIASILDGLDGLVARLVNESTPFGAEIDSFSDAVSFGVAPGLLIYHVALKPFGYIGLIFGFLPVLTGIIRLVKFNLIPEGFKSKTKFTGLPIPATAIILAGFYVYANSVQGIKTTPIFFALIPALSILMLSPIPYRKLPGTLRKTRFSIYRKITMVVSGALVIWNPALTIFPLMMIYLISGPVEWGIHHLRRIRVDNEPEEQDGEI